MARIYSDWTSGANYSTGDKVKSSGIIYEALGTITGSAVLPRLDTANWQVIGVFRIEDYYSLIEAVNLELNTSAPEIVESIPHFINLAEDSFSTRLRPPLQRRRTVAVTDAEGRIEIPQDLLEVINLRINDVSSTTNNVANSLLDRGRTEILAGNFEEYNDLKRYYSGDNYYNYKAVYDAEAPIYWYDNRYFYIAPLLETGTEIELWYYAAIPQLGSVVFEVNPDGVAINAEGQTSAQWVAAGGGNTADNFVQDSTIVEVNWFVRAASQMLLYGAVLNAAIHLRDDSRIPVWQQMFEKAEIETRYKIERFESHRAHSQQLSSIYSS